MSIRPRLSFHPCFLLFSFHPSTFLSSHKFIQKASSNFWPISLHDSRAWPFLSCEKFLFPKVSETTQPCWLWASPLDWRLLFLVSSPLAHVVLCFEMEKKQTIQCLFCPICTKRCHSKVNTRTSITLPPPRVGLLKRWKNKKSRLDFYLNVGSLAVGTPGAY